MIILDNNENINGIEPMENDEDINNNTETSSDNEKKEICNNDEETNTDVNIIETEEISESASVKEKPVSEQNNTNNYIPNSSNKYNDTIASTFPQWDLLPPGVPIKRIRRK